MIFSMRRRLLARALCAATLPGVAAFAAVAGPPAAPADTATSASPTPLDFGRFHNTPADVRGTIAKGETRRYSFAAKANQWVEIAVEPGSRMTPVGIKVPGVSTPPGERPASPVVPFFPKGDAIVWSGQLPADGTFLLEVGPAARAGNFHLHVWVRYPFAKDCEFLAVPLQTRCFHTLAANKEEGRTQAYAALAKELSDDDDKARLATAEKAWQAYRDATCAWEAALYADSPLQDAMVDACRARVTGAREDELMAQLARYENP
jgi:uncharacterized protein YecT (DUF1311 family)